VGWVYEYVLDGGDQYDLQQLRSIQDWFLKYELLSVDGVAEVASIGGHVKQYQVEIDPNKLLAYDIPLSKVKMAIKRSNNDVGGRLVEMSETEFMVRGKGYIQTVEDVENVPIGTDGNGTPVTIRNVANVQIGPDLRRGVADWNGEGEAVGGVVIMRFGENALQTIDNVKAKLKELESGLPEGITIKTAYDRSSLIKRAIEFLEHKLLEESIVVAIIVLIFLLHFRSSLVAIISLPIGILAAFMVMYFQGINANIMSLSGIAIAIGAMVDAAIVMVENAHKHLEKDRGKKDHWRIIIDASKEVGPALFFSLLIITVSFLPIFALQGQEGRLFKPLAFTKTYAMAAAALLSVTLVPVLMGYLIRGKIQPEHKNPVNRFLIWIYKPIINLALRFKWTTIIASIAILAISIVPLQRLGSEFMPPIEEGDLLYMPTTDPGISITKAKELLQQTDKIIATFPEVESVFGKSGRAQTSTDPAPLSMFETIIQLKPEDEWREGMTMDKLKQEMDAAIKIPGLTNAWTMPIKTRIDMLSTGIKTPIGIKVTGPDLQTLSDLSTDIASVVRDVPGTLSVFADKTTGGNYLDFNIDRKEAARYGLTTGDVQDVIQSAIGGMNVTETVEGLERYPVNVRYARETRENLTDLGRVLISTPSGAQIPIEYVADLQIRKDAPVIKTENARYSSWIYVDLTTSDLGNYVNQARQTVDERLDLPSGYSLTWSGQYEYMERAKKRLQVVVPITLLIIFLLLYFNFKNLQESLIVLLTLPFSLVGSFWLLYILDYNLSVAVGVGAIALAGVAAEIGVIMLTYLDNAYNNRKYNDKMKNLEDLKQAIFEGSAQRIRPIFMTVCAITGGLLPIMWGTGTGATVMKRIAAPMVGGMVSATILSLVVIPVIYYLWKSREVKRLVKTTSEDQQLTN
jgi:Cu(I)/Ag(I) efflux system membrane protein CusA/SilA